MQIPIYHVDAFTDKIFAGNPAAICLLQEWLPDEILFAIAKENNLPVTTFLVREKNHYVVRWITPEYELNLCGHGSLSAGFVILSLLEPTWQDVNMRSLHEIIQISRQGKDITLNFPAKEFVSCTLPLLEEGLGIKPAEVYQYQTDRCFVVCSSEDEVKALQPDISILKKLPHRGITVTATGKNCDFVSRTFYPQKSIWEDPVTGASHALLAPYWSQRLNKIKLHARQVSARGGEMICEYKDNCVYITSSAVLYSQGIIHI